MASGNFTSMNKARPGVYVNFASGKKQTGIRASGTVAMTMALDWGVPNEFTEITNQSNLLHVFGYSIEDDKMYLLKEALKTAERVLVFNVAGAGSSRATGLLATDVDAEAVKFGELGNQISVVVEEELDGTFNVYTHFKNTLVDKQNISAVDEFKDNGYIRITGTGELEDNAGVVLTGARTESSVNDNYIEYFKALEMRDFYAFCVDTNDTTIIQSAVTYCKKWRDQEGKKVVFVTANTEADYEGVVNVGNGVILTNGTKLSALECTPYIAGAMASAGVTQSLTYHVYEGAVDVNPRMLPTDVENALMKGQFVFTYAQNKVVVEQDINSLVTYTAAKNKDFRKNKIVRIIDTLHNELNAMYSNSFIGVVSNNEDGRELLKKDILALLDDLKTNGALNDYESEDVEVLPGNDKDIVIVNMQISIADAMEKLYVTVTLN